MAAVYHTIQASLPREKDRSQQSVRERRIRYICAQLESHSQHREPEQKLYLGIIQESVWDYFRPRPPSPIRRPGMGAMSWYNFTRAHKEIIEAIDAAQAFFTTENPWFVECAYICGLEPEWIVRLVREHYRVGRDGFTVNGRR